MAFAPDQSTYATPSGIKGEIGRPALVYRLTAAQDLPLVAVLAPSGYGKSTLVAQWLRTLSEPAIWCKLSPDTSEIEAVIRAMTAALREVQPEPVGGQSPEQFVQWLAQLPQDYKFVFDDVHVLSPDAQKWLYQVINHLRTRHQFIFIGYELSDFPLAKLIGSGSAEVFGVEDLSFSLDEVSELCEARGLPGASRQLWEELEGWPLGISLSSTRRTLDLSPESLIRDMLAELPEGYSQALTSLAIYTEWSPAHAPLLPAGWLEVVRRSGLPIVPVAWNIYRPHTYLLKVLDELLKFDSERYLAAHQQAGERALKRDQWHAAIEHFLAAGELQQALQAASKLVVYYWNRGMFGPVQKALELFEWSDLPVVRKNDLAMAWNRMGQRERAIATLTEMRRVGEYNAETLWNLAKLLGIANSDNTIKLCREALTMTDDVDEHLGILSTLSASLRENGQAEAAIAVCEEGLLYYQQHPEALPTTEIELQRRYSAALTSCGRIKEAIQKANYCITASRQMPNTVAYFLALVVALEAVNAQADLVSVSEFSIMVDKIDTKQRVHYGWVNVKLINAQHYIILGDYLGAKLRFDEIERADIPTGTYIEALHLLVEADLNLLAANLEVAEKLIALSADHPYREYQNYKSFLLGLLSFHRQQSAKAQQWFEQVTPDDPWLRRRIEKLAPTDVLTDETTHNPSLNQEWGLQIYTLGGFRAFYNGKALHIPLARAKDLLVLLALRGSARREEFVDALWDGEGDKRHADHFKVLVRRLRLALQDVQPEESGIESVVSASGHLSLAPQLKPWIDVLQLRDLAREQGATPEQLASGLSLYTGEFLPDSDAEWAVMEREATSGLLIAIAQRLYHHAAGTNEQRLQALRCWISLEPLQHEPYELLIRTLQQHGDEPGARLVYREFEQVLERELGEKPIKSWQEMTSSSAVTP